MSVKPYHREDGTMIDVPDSNELGYYPKDGWVEVLYDVCPQCGAKLPTPTDWDLQWIHEEPYCLFTGAYCRPACHKTWLVWRSSDKQWHYEIPDNIHHKFKGDPHGLNSVQDVKPDTEDVLHRDRDLQGSVPMRNVQDLADGSDQELPSKGRMSVKHTYDF